MRRRTLLRRGVVLAALGLAGCTGQPGSDAEPTQPATTTAMAGTQSDTPSATERPTPSPTDTPAAMTTSGGGYERPAPAETATATASSTPTAAATPTAGQTVVVGPDGDFAFSPSSFEVAAGETVVWTWDSSNHNVRPSAQPDDADWSGTPGTDGSTYDEGYTYAHTFEVAGAYEYYCAPHRSLGMTGSFEVA